MKYFLIRNQVMVTVVTAWFIAQLLKTVIHFLIEKKLDPERLIGSGGMPSSHSATVCALATSAAYMYSIQSFEFTISFVLAVIVMHDARGVRLETGKQAKILNMILEENPFEWSAEVRDNNLKELVGHTPLQVVCGAVLGIAVAVLMELLIFG